jgi:hypothetical protein
MLHIIAQKQMARCVIYFLIELFLVRKNLTRQAVTETNVLDYRRTLALLTLS